MAGTVKMVRDKGEFLAPYSANVHPSEVANFALQGWVKVPPVVRKQPARKRAAAKKLAAKL